MDDTEGTVKIVTFLTSGHTLDELRLNEIWCDATIKVGDVEFPVHRLIMCACMPYFHALAVDSSEPDRRLFVFDNVTPETMELIITFAYTSDVNLTNDNVFDVMIAAERFSMTSLINFCSEFLENNLSPENCIGVWQMTDMAYSPILRNTAFNFICDHFEEVVKSEEFLRLTVEELAEILGCDGLCVEQESTAFESVLKWIAHMPDDRRDDITTLLSKVRLGLLSLTYLQSTVLTNDVVTSNKDSKLMVLNAIKVVSEPENSPSSGFYHEITVPRLPKAVLLATGGWSNFTTTDTVMSYDYTTNSWFSGPLSRLREPVAYHGSAFLNGSIYIVGGMTEAVSYTNNVHRFDLITHTWNEVAPMHHRRGYVSVTVLNQCIYAMGGFNGVHRLITAEVYEPETNQWTFIASMNHVRSDASCTTLRNKIYICGGYTGVEQLFTAECYDPSTDQWTLIAPMSSCRSGLGVVTYMDEVLALGGFGFYRRLSSAEAYNPVTNTWRNVRQMFSTRSNFGIAVVNKRVFVVGGWNQSISCDVECYNSTTDSWSPLCELDQPCSGQNCVVLSGIPSLDEYSASCYVLPNDKTEEPTFEEVVQDP